MKDISNKGDQFGSRTHEPLTQHMDALPTELPRKIRCAFHSDIIFKIKIQSANCILKLTKKIYSFFFHLLIIRKILNIKKNFFHFYPQIIPIFK